MAVGARYRRQVGAVRPSHLLFTAGVGATVDLPNFSVMVQGLDEWRYDNVPDFQPLQEPRLLAAVRSVVGPSVESLRPVPWMEEEPDPAGPASRVGVPVAPFPQWMHCTACNELAPLASQVWGFENANPYRPDEARFFHSTCQRRRKPRAVAARFVLACTNGHLDEFPYVAFTHHGGQCPAVSHPTMQMQDYGGNLGANVQLRCTNCGSARNIRSAQGDRGRANLPRCRGRHPHLGIFEEGGCDCEAHMLVVGASNQWFAQQLSALAVPPTGASALEAKIEQLWEYLSGVSSLEQVKVIWTFPQMRVLHDWKQTDVLAAVERHREVLAANQPEVAGYPDLRTPEWEIFTAEPGPDPSPDFTVRRDPAGLPPELAGVFSDIVQVERLREVRALIGFSRLDAPDPDEPDLVTRVRLERSEPKWVPASEVRGEGIFLRVSESLLEAWEREVSSAEALEAHRDAYARYRQNRYSDRVPGPFDPVAKWPGPRYIALHTLSHLLLRTIALECGYSAASLSERIYSNRPEEEPRAGILLYTVVPDADGTLGGLVSLAEPDRLPGIVRRALEQAMQCSSDPLCAERQPQEPDDVLHGAACHACLFVSETACERGNRFLDRRFVVPIEERVPALARGLV